MHFNLIIARTTCFLLIIIHASEEVNITGRMFKGNLASWKDHRFYASLNPVHKIRGGQSTWIRECSGAFISKRWVVTAGGCLPIKRINPHLRYPLQVNTDLSGVNATTISETVRKAVSLFHHPQVHPSYKLENSGQVFRWAPDIGLALLRKDAPPAVAPIRLLPPDKERSFLKSTNSSVSMIAGGNSMTHDYNGTWPLKKVTFQMNEYRCFHGDEYKLRVPFALCWPLFPPTPFLTCMGDGGSPVYGINRRGRFLLGVYSSITNRCQDKMELKRKPVNSIQRVTQYAAWILHTIDANSEDERFIDIMSLYMVHTRLMGSSLSVWTY